jgi:hypothetical protein
MPAWATLLRELLYRVLKQIDKNPGEAHINTRFDRVARQTSGRQAKVPASKTPLRTQLARVLLGFSFNLVRIARRLTIPPAVGPVQITESKEKT